MGSSSANQRGVSSNVVDQDYKTGGLELFRIEQMPTVLPHTFSVVAAVVTNPDIIRYAVSNGPLILVKSPAEDDTGGNS